VATAISSVREAGHAFPLEREFRIASAKWLAGYALHSPDLDWSRIAIAEIRHAMWYDRTEADILGQMIVLELKIGDIEHARGHFAWFKRIAQRSPMIKILEQGFHDIPPAG
jgi:hypothetical protein